MSELGQAFMSLPPITRTILGMTGGVTIPPLLGLISPYQIVFFWPAIRHKFQLWRLITPFFYAGVCASHKVTFYRRSLQTTKLIET